MPAAQTTASLLEREARAFMAAARKETGTCNGSQFPDDFGHEFPRQSLLFDDERILRTPT
jgi:hypothetical protein